MCSLLFTKNIDMFLIMLKGANMDINLIKTYMETSPYILEDILNIMKYRNLRTEQSYYARLAYEYDHVPISQQCKEVSKKCGIIS